MFFILKDTFRILRDSTFRYVAELMWDAELNYFGNLMKNFSNQKFFFNNLIVLYAKKYILIKIAIIWEPKN